MRECIRCKTEMIEDCDLRVESSGYGLSATNTTNKIFAGHLGKPKVAICPKCGEISVYIANVGDLRKNN